LANQPLVEVFAMYNQNLPSTQKEQPKPNNKGNSVIGWLVLIGIGVGVCWIYNHNQEREAQRKREIFREVNWVVSDDGVKMYKTSPNQNVDQRLKEINSRYQRPIWENVPEDRSGKGKIIISP
jgi:hypothetical protein